jgi:hypothetical protein
VNALPDLRYFGRGALREKHTHRQIVADARFFSLVILDRMAFLAASDICSDA